MNRTTSLRSFLRQPSILAIKDGIMDLMDVLDGATVGVYYDAMGRDERVTIHWRSVPTDPSYSDSQMVQSDGTPLAFVIPYSVIDASLDREVTVHYEVWLPSGSLLYSYPQTFRVEERREVPPVSGFAGPYRSALSKDGRYVLVCNSNGSTVSVIDTRSHYRITDIPNFSRPHDVVMSTDGNRAYVAQARGVGVINVGDFSYAGTLRGGQGATALALSGFGDYLYVANTATTSVDRVDITANVVTSIDVGVYPVSVTALEGDPRVYVTCSGSGTLAVIEDGVVTKSVEVGRSPNGGKVRPYTRHIYIAITGEDRIKVVDLDTYLIIAELNFTKPHAIDFSPDGSRGYVVSNIGSGVGVFDCATHLLIGTIATPAMAYGLVVAEEGKRLYLNHYTLSTVSMPVSRLPGALLSSR